MMNLPRTYYLGLASAVALASAVTWGMSPYLPDVPNSANPVSQSHVVDARPASYQSDPHGVADVVAAAQPAVVSITVEQDSKSVAFGGDPFGEMFRQFMGRGGMEPAPREQASALGSGFLINDNGDILTNNHVVENGTRFTVEFSDKSIAEAKLVGSDPQTDLALLHVDKKPKITPLALADSDKLRIGDSVIAIGNPYGVGQTVTTGIISARGRSLGTSSYVDYIQTDAPINQGNSGGPLLDYAGNVVGVNSAIYSPNGGSVGIGFAVPSNTVSQVVRQLRADGKVTRAYLGVSIQDVTPSIAAAVGLKKAEGAIVTTVSDDGPSVGKLKAGDIVMRFDGTAIREGRDLSRAASSAKIGEIADLDIVRQGKAMNIKIKLAQLQTATSEQTQQSGPTKGKSTPKLGLSLAPLADMRDQIGAPANLTGIVVMDVDRDGPADRAGIRSGDVIERVGGQGVSNASELDAALGKSRENTALMLINRRGNRTFLTVELG
jgi:serine protease Do